MDNAHFDAAPIGSADSEGTQTPPLTPPLCERGGEVETLSECNAGEQTPPLAPPLCERGGEVILLSVGRFCHQKNFDNVPDIARRVIGNGLDIKWYLIGFGDEELIRRKITEAGMEEHVIILGKKNNPFCWPITAAKVKNEQTAELSLINDYGSEDLTATLTRENDSIYVLKQEKGSTLKVPKNGKWQKLPKSLSFKRR
jgi:glycosyltransferase involved in cell wall biosynthesis